MRSETTKLTIRLPNEDVAFAKAYAKAHDITLTEVIDRYLRRLRALEHQSPDPKLDVITGLVPEEVDTKEAYRRHLLDKHSQ